MSKFSTFAIIATTMLAAPAMASPPRAAPPRRAAVLGAVVRDLCDRQVVLLGEATHGDGATVAFKVALVERLVTRCHFRAVLFEAGFYDFAELARRIDVHESAPPALLSSAVGWLWARDAEFAPLPGFLMARATKHRLLLGGLDDQLGAAGAFYSLTVMPDELAGLLPVEHRDACRALLRQRLNYDFPPDTPHTPATRDRLLACVAEADQRNRADADMGRRDRRAALLANIARALPRDFVDLHDNIAARDRSMALNFAWFAERLPPRTKIIVWTASAHAAKTAAADPDFAAGVSLGAIIHARYRRDAFALGFSALGGEYRYGFKAGNRPLPEAQPGSLEARALPAGDDIGYIGPQALAALGTVDGAAFSHEVRRARWADAFDGVVVFGREHSATTIDPPAIPSR